MADIRNTGYLDTFDRPADEDPLQPPWYTVSGQSNMYLDSIHSTIRGTSFPPDGSMAYYSAQAFYGPSIETWGKAEGSPGLTGGWRFGMYTTASLIAGGSPHGYQAIPWHPIGGDPWILRRYDESGFTQLATSAYDSPDLGNYCLMRRVGNNIEVWMSVTDDPNGTWLQIFNVADTTYMYGPFFFVYGGTGVENGWGGMGGGLKNRQLIYRWLRR